MSKKSSLNVVQITASNDLGSAKAFDVVLMLIFPLNLYLALFALYAVSKIPYRLIEPVNISLSN